MPIRLYKIEEKSDNQKFNNIVRKFLTKRLKEDDSFAKNFYASLCNTIWFNESTQDIFSCTWRSAGGIVADIRDKGENYMDFYCSGGEGQYYSKVYKELAKVGYKPLKYKDINILKEFHFK